MFSIRQACLDLTRYHWRHEHGDITAYGTWWLGLDSGPLECLVLVPTHKQSSEKAMPCVVMIQDAWRWDEKKGDPADAARQSFQFAQALGLDVNNMKNVFRVVTIIHDHIGDLLSIPPMPNSMREFVTLGEAKVIEREGGSLVRHEEIIQRV